MEQNTGPQDRSLALKAFAATLDSFEAHLSDHSESDLEWGRRMLRALEGIHDVLEDRPGLFYADERGRDELLGQKPHLAPRVDEHLAEHAEIARDCASLYRKVREDLAFQRLNSDIIDADATVILARCRAHLLRANFLVTEAYFTVEGGEGG